MALHSSTSTILCPDKCGGNNKQCEFWEIKFDDLSVSEKYKFAIIHNRRDIISKLASENSFAGFDVIYLALKVRRFVDQLPNIGFLKTPNIMSMLILSIFAGNDRYIRKYKSFASYEFSFRANPEALSAINEPFPDEMFHKLEPKFRGELSGFYEIFKLFTDSLWVEFGKKDYFRIIDQFLGGNNRGRGFKQLIHIIYLSSNTGCAVKLLKAMKKMVLKNPGKYKTEITNTIDRFSDKYMKVISDQGKFDVIGQLLSWQYMGYERPVEEFAKYASGINPQESRFIRRIYNNKTAKVLNENIGMNNISTIVPKIINTDNFITSYGLHMKKKHVPAIAKIRFLNSDETKNAVKSGKIDKTKLDKDIYHLIWSLAERHEIPADNDITSDISEFAEMIRYYCSINDVIEAYEHNIPEKDIPLFRIRYYCLKKEFGLC